TGRKRARRLAPFAAAIVAAALLACGITLGVPDQDGATATVASGAGHTTVFASTHVAKPRRAQAAKAGRLPVAVVTIGPSADTVSVPSSYFGISTEYWALPLFERNTPVFERVLRMLHVQGDGPLVLRIGGDSADHSFWAPKARKMPGWAFAVTPTFLSRLRALVERDRVRLIVDLNLVTDTPFTAAAWARAAETTLPRGSIIGFEVGNEPDLYERKYWEATMARSPLESSPLPLEVTASSYVADFDDYARVLGEGAPDIPLFGPAVAHPRVSLDWISTLIANERSELGEVTGHLYPYSACVKHPSDASFPTVARLLSPEASSGLANDVAGAVATAHASGLKFRLTELNSVTCGGKGGVSNTFATALWAPDALFTLMRAGVDGVNLHVREYAINAPFSLNKYGLNPRPLLYGLDMFERTLGAQAQLVRLHMSEPRRSNLSAWAVRVRGDVLHVLLIDKGNHDLQVDLHLPATGPATVQRLTAPSASSTSGETLDGQRIGPEGNWIGTRQVGTIAAGRQGYVLTIPRQSEALVGVRLGSAPRHAAHHRATVRRRDNHHATSTLVAERPDRRSHGAARKA
ncbi:MAG: hypothetical protein JO325_11345, partial [Solirubrobacterales bacterium]|nr:hypothetical protein [Solirubrobacterales bacterium]